MNIQEKLIPDIYNFCDSWCERCLFTKRCQSYRIQIENGLNQPIDPNATLVQQLTEALALTSQYLAKGRATNSPDNALSLEQQALPVLPEKHPVTQLAHDYLRQTGNWLRIEKSLLEQAGLQQLQEVELGIRSELEALARLNALKDAWEMIKWYRTLIPVKTASAVRLFSEPGNDPNLTLYYTGKAKLVLVSIDRSMLAWQTLLSYYPEKTDSLLDSLVLLRRISHDLAILFPDAHAFRRPGFD